MDINIYNLYGEIVILKGIIGRKEFSDIDKSFNGRFIKDIKDRYDIGAENAEVILSCLCWIFNARKPERLHKTFLVKPVNSIGRLIRTE